MDHIDAYEELTKHLIAVEVAAGRFSEQFPEHADTFRRFAERMYVTGLEETAERLSTSRRMELAVEVAGSGMVDRITKK